MPCFKLLVILRFGMSEIATIISYPTLLTLDETPELLGKLVYVVKAYPLNGLAVLMAYNKPNTSIRFGDWDGNYLNPLEPNPLISEFMQAHAPNFIGLMTSAKIKQALFYLSKDKDGLRLVDMRVALDKMVGPGMLRDLLSKVVATQEVVSTTGLTQETLAAIKKGDGIMAGDLIIKPSVFKTITRGEKPNMVMYPMYGMVSRCQKLPS